ncbi:MAG: alpha/beta hydrolase, partial [Polaromonas sp.]
MKRWPFLFLLLLAFALLAGGTALDEKQRALIFQPGDRSWGASAEMASGMQDVWIAFDSQSTGRPVRLHGLWLPADGKLNAQGKPSAAPLLLFLHGARWNVEGSAPRIRRMQALGFSVLAIDYRG